jgi:hypothetical protein
MTYARALRCPSCSHRPLRAFEHRLVCDACNGMLVPINEFVTAIHEIDPSRGPLEFADPRDSGKRCPRCARPMSTSTVSIGAIPLPESMLSCEQDGMWVSQAVLAAVFARLSRNVRIGGGAGPSRDAGVYAPVTSGGIAAAMNSIHEAFAASAPASVGLAISRWHHTRPSVHTLYVSAYKDRHLGCPVCKGVELDYRGERWACEACHGSFVESAALTAMVTDMINGPWELPIAAGERGERGCPVCGDAMRCEVLEAQAIDRCAAHGVWFDDHELQDALHHAGTGSPTTLGGWLKRLFHRDGARDPKHRP